MPPNPFRIEPPAERPFFAGREGEVDRIRKALLSPGARLLVHGPRRVGKTWALHAARKDAERRGGVVLIADFSTASAPTDLANRVLAAGARSLTHAWTDAVGELVSRIELAVRLEPDPAGGPSIPSLDPGLRRLPPEVQWTLLGRVLDTLDRMAARGDRVLAVVLDEFQELSRFGGQEAEARLRNLLGEHRNVSYVLAGSRVGLIGDMLARGRPLHQFLGTMAMDALEGRALGDWVDRRMSSAGRPAPGLGARCVQVAGPRTGDVVRLARASFQVAASGEPEPDAGPEPETLVSRAFERLVVASDSPFRAFWRDLTPYRQNVFRAVAAAERGLTTSETLERFGLGHSGSATNAAAALVDDEWLVRVESGSGYDFDSPFFRGWVVRNALPDLGIRTPGPAANPSAP